MKSYTEIRVEKRDFETKMWDGGYINRNPLSVSLVNFHLFGIFCFPHQIDSLDTLALLGDRDSFSTSVEWIGKNLRFDIVSINFLCLLCMNLSKFICKVLFMDPVLKALYVAYKL